MRAAVSLRDKAYSISTTEVGVEAEEAYCLPHPPPVARSVAGSFTLPAHWPGVIRALEQLDIYR